MNASNLAGRIKPVTKRPHRILVDARKLKDGGIGVYLDNLICGLSKDDRVAVTLLSSRELIADYDWYPNVKLIEESAKSYSLDEYLLMSRRIDYSSFDLLHIPHYTLPFGVTIPTVVTIHDIIHVSHPERWYYPWVAKPLLRSALKRASRIITVSETSKRELLRLSKNEIGLEERISVIPNALNPSFEGRTDGMMIGRLKRLGIQEGFLLAVVSMDKPHKGVGDLLTAFSRLSNEMAHGNKLVLVGKGSQAVSTKLPNVVVLGAVETELLKALYAQARAVIVPSLVEGFSFPVLEAKAYSKPVLVRPVPAILELIDENDLVTRDLSVEALEEGLLKLICLTPPKVVPFNKNGKLDRFTVPNLTERTVNLYREVLSA